MSFLNQHRRAFLTVVCLFCTGWVAAAWWFGFEPLLRLEYAARDFLTRHSKKLPPNPDIVFLAIDQASVSLDGAFQEELDASPALRIMKENGWPWSRDVYAMVIDRLAGAGARVIAFDMLFPTERPGDDDLRAALERHADKVILGANFVEAESTKSLTPPSASLIPPGEKMDPRVGYVNFWPDGDGIVRRVNYRITLDEVNGMAPAADSEVLDSLSTRVLGRLGKANAVPTEPACFRFTEDFVPHSLWEIFVPKIWNGTPYNGGEYFRGKIVLIGPEGDWAKDFLPTAFGQTPGPELHLHALNAALNNAFIHEPSRAIILASILIAGAIAWALSAFVAQPIVRFGIFIVGSGAYAGVATMMLGGKEGGVLLSLVPPLLAADGAGFVWLICEHMLERMEKARTRRMLERYVAKDLVKEILDNPASLFSTLGGVRKGVALLFSDLRNFTTITEEADSGQLVAQLNEYFTEMVKWIFDTRGTPDKFIGDAIMAVWGSVYTEGAARDVERAVTAAVEMLAALEQLNRNWEKRGIRTFQMGIGINYGEAIVGNIGAAGEVEKMDLTVIGDPVNLASRLEGLTKQYGVELLLGESAADLVEQAFYLQFVDLVRVKGKMKPIRIYTVHGLRRNPLPDSINEYLKRFAEGIQRFRAREFSAARSDFEACRTHRPGDKVTEIYIGRCDELERNPPGPDWDGVVVMKEK